MKNLFFSIFLTSFSLLAQEINPNHFVLTFNTGANMTLMFTSLSEYSGGVVGAFYDLNENGIIDDGYIYGSTDYTECVGISTVIANNQAGFALWGDDSSISENVGLGFGVIPQFAILYQGEVILIDLGDQFTGYTTNGVEVISEITIIDNTSNIAPEILVIPPTIVLVAGETIDLSSVEDLWNDGVFYDSDNSLEELSIEINVNPEEIILEWDNSFSNNPLLSAALGFTGSTTIEFCVSDLEYTVCESNNIIVHENSISNEIILNPSDFVSPLNTGSNMTLMMNAPKLDAYAGSQLGVFKDVDASGDLDCIGLYTITEGNFGFPIWADDTYSDEVDGLVSGDIPQFAILTDGEVKTISMYPLFEGFEINAIHVATNFFTPIIYDLNTGWNMVGYVGVADNNDIITQVNAALGNGSSTEESFQLIKNVLGQFWSPEFAQLNTLTQGEGYMMYLTSEPTSISFQTPSAYQFGIEYPLTTGWNMVAFTGDVDSEKEIVTAMNIALEQGTTTSTFQLIKNVTGQFWSPEFAQLSSFTPGEAYMMYVIGESTSINFQREIDNSTPAPGGGF